METGHLTLENDLYSITEKGRANGAACESSLPYTVKQKCGANLTHLNGILRRNAQVRSGVEDRPEGAAWSGWSWTTIRGICLPWNCSAATGTRPGAWPTASKEEPERVYHDVITALLEWEKNR